MRGRCEGTGRSRWRGESESHVEAMVYNDVDDNIVNK